MQMQHTLPALLIGLVVMFMSANALAQDSKADRLRGGEIIVTTNDVSGSDVPQFIVEGVIDAPPSKVWDVIIDCAKYSQWYTSLASSSLVSKSGNTWICQEEAKMPFPFPNLDARVKVTLDKKKDRWERRWTMIEGDYETNSGKCTLEAFEGQSGKTLVTYVVSVDPKVAVPQAMIENGQKKKLPKVLEDIRDEVARR
jgi:uncharacterized protein YndB with AHSA1/START domain